MSIIIPDHDPVLSQPGRFTISHPPPTVAGPVTSKKHSSRAHRFMMPVLGQSPCACLGLVGYLRPYPPWCMPCSPGCPRDPSSVPDIPRRRWPKGSNPIIHHHHHHHHRQSRCTSIHHPASPDSTSALIPHSPYCLSVLYSCRVVPRLVCCSRRPGAHPWCVVMLIL